MARSTFSGPIRSLAGFEGTLIPSGPQPMMPYTVATLPDAADTPNAVVLVTDANSDAGTVAFSDGTDWIDVKTGVAVVVTAS